MIVYLDTSALVKLFVDEPGSEEVLAWTAEAVSVACSSIGFPEAISAFSRRLRSESIGRAVYDRVLDELDRQWDDVVTVPVDERLAGDLARRHPLSGADAIHLAAALTLLGANLPIAFCGYDERLSLAAAAEGLRVLPKQLTSRNRPG